jgi:hypothetical protein
MNVVVSNVRGPDVPLYMAGARLVSFSPISIAIDGLGLNVTAFSYDGVMWVCVVACRDMLPDPAFFADCLRRSFEALEGAARVSDAPEARAAPRRRKGTARGARRASRRVSA